MYLAELAMSKVYCKSKKFKKRSKKASFMASLNATHECRKCGRLAECKKRLCKAMKLVCVPLD